jgi:hypothetical protein
LILATEELGIRGIPVAAGETADDAIARRILQILREVTAGTLNAIPMGGISLTLRRELDWDVLESAIAATVERVDDLRGFTPVAPLQPAAAPPVGAPPAGAPPTGAPAAGTPPVLDSVQN